MATSVVETMTGTDDHIRTRWELEASPQEVYGLIADAPSYPRWWPSVFLESRLPGGSVLRDASSFLALLDLSCKRYSDNARKSDYSR